MFIYLLSFLIIVDIIFLILWSNPVHCMLLLFLIVIKYSIILMFLRAEYLGFLMMMIYLGAILVLFVFIVMMVNVNVFSLYHDSRDWAFYFYL